MTSFPSSAGGALGHRQVRNLYPGITENHLRYLEKWGLLRQSHVPRGAREYSFPDIQTIKQLATELERGTPLKTILRSLAADHQGQMQLDFQEGLAASDVPRAKVVALEQHRARRRAGAGAARDAVVGFPFNDPQSALAAKYFVEGSRLDDGEERNAEAAKSAYRKALIIDADLVARDRQSRQHPLRARRADRGAGALRAGHRPGARLLRGALQSGEHSSRPGTIRSTR